LEAVPDKIVAVLPVVVGRPVPTVEIPILVPDWELVKS
jgi:hypothetical protein